MTEQPTEQFDDIDKLHAQLNAIQTRHGQALREAQETEGKLLDKSAYNAKRKQITDLHEQASRTLIQAIEETTEATRKNLALNLRYEGNTEVDRQAWFHAVEMVEAAGNDVNKIEALIHRAVTWKDSALARALTMKHCGTPDRRAMHQVLAGVDERVARSFAFENRHGAYAKKSGTGGTWAGWQTYSNGRDVEIPGRPAELQPAYIREQKRLQWEQRRAGK